MLQLQELVILLAFPGSLPLTMFLAVQTQKLSRVLCPSATHAGVESFDVSLKEQKVVVRGNVTPEAVLATVSKTGKKTELVQ